MGNREILSILSLLDIKKYSIFNYATFGSKFNIKKFHNKENEFCLLDTDNKMANDFAIFLVIDQVLHNYVQHLQITQNL